MLDVRPVDRLSVELAKGLVSRRPRGHESDPSKIRPPPDIRFTRRPVITFLHGRLVESLPTRVVVDVGGIGYEVLIPLSSYDKLPVPGGDVHLLTHLAVREDAHILYGFMTGGERDLFRLLIDTVSGIGPKIALNVLSGLSVAAFGAAVRTGDY